MLSELTEAQTAAFDRFTRLRVGALFMRQGTGKTRVAVELVNHHQAQLDLVVYLTATSLVASTETELAKWGCQVDTVVVGYETVASSEWRWLDLLAEVEGCRFMLIADESIFVKNPATKRYERTKTLRSKARLVLVLNGSPVTRDLWDLYWQMDLLSPKIVGMGPQEFQQNYFTEVRYQKFGDKKPTEFYKVYEPNVKHLMSLIAPYVFEADLEFPYETTVETVVHDASRQVTDRYGALRDETLRRLATVGGAGFVGVLANMNRLANLDETKHTRIAGMVKARRVVVYTPWLEEHTRLVELTGAYGITGATPLDRRSQTIAGWETDDKPLILTYGVGAYGLNLQAANETHFASVTFDYAQMEQAKHRVRRLGQTRDVKLVYHLTAHKISETIWKNLDRKNWLAGLLRTEDWGKLI